MNKIGALISIFCLTGGLAFATPMSGSISQDYDFGFETIIKRKFGEIVKMSKIFEKSDDFVYSKGYRPVYMLSIRDFYNIVPKLTSNIEKRKVPEEYNLSLSDKVQTDGNVVSLSLNGESTGVQSVSVKDNYAQEKAEYQKLLAQNPDRIELLYKYAQFLYANKQYKEAIAVLNDVIQKDSGFVLASYTLGNIYFDMGEYLEAIKANIVVIKRNPYCADAYFNIASALEKLHKYNLALDYYQKCLSINSGDTQAKKAIQRLSELTLAE